MICKWCQSEINDKCKVCPVCTRDLFDEKIPSMKNMRKVNSYGSTDPKIWIALLVGIAVLVLPLLFAACGRLLF